MAMVKKLFRLCRSTLKLLFFYCHPHLHFSFAFSSLSFSYIFLYFFHSFWLLFFWMTTVFYSFLAHSFFPQVKFQVIKIVFNLVFVYSSSLLRFVTFAENLITIQKKNLYWKQFSANFLSHPQLWKLYFRRKIKIFAA